MREARLRWYGHVLRSDDNSVAKSAMNISVDGRRPRGRSKTRWLNRRIGYAFTEAHTRRRFQSRKMALTHAERQPLLLGTWLGRRRRR
ncbi:hypothetical protein Y032_0075g935 [Ancylostoma ceylanicum]|uniref:Uncharacterized protein n=1 Tax=Ancylostoma ceylanicum TaxID=53326 RepID=A0A016TUT7_9BILA|nr:hypothetical protein Y032_0075g935 [Ancylostoma ceylanicum]